MPTHVTIEKSLLADAEWAPWTSHPSPRAGRRMSGNSHDYEALHGTQAEQAAKQASAGVHVFPDGPWRLERENWAGEKIVLYNSVRSTRNEAERLAAAEYTRTGLMWSIVRFYR